MDTQGAAEIHKDLVFVGGGHAHALALRMLAMAPITGLRITLISPASHTPYSGMLPGLVAGHYNFEQTHIDLARLCQWAEVRFICAPVTAIDPQLKQISIEGRPALSYDVLSIDVGSEPELDSVPGARRFSVPVKPVAGLWQRWNRLREKLQASPGGSEHRVAMVGGGAGSVELITAMAERFSSDKLLSRQRVSFTLYCGASAILQGYNARARKSAELALTHYGIELHLGCRVEKVESGVLCMQGGDLFSFDELFWCTGAAAMSWIASSGLETDERGFLVTTDTLQSTSDSAVFGTGDCATQLNHPRPKAGVYAVRQGPVLAENLRNTLLSRPLKNHIPQHKFLSLLSLGTRRATADRGFLSATGKWVWRWKDKIDREFMARFEVLPQMQLNAASDTLHEHGGPEELQVPCGGCGAKVGADVLASVLSNLSGLYPQHCPVTGADDAVLIPGSSASAIIQSIDTLRQIVADPFVMGRIAANHALSDLYASGAQPVSALASVCLPFATVQILPRDLEQLLAGALHEMATANCILTGGHTMAGSELNIGFVVNGISLSGDGNFLPKRGMREGDVLVLTKALGVGTLFAAHMQQRADGRDIQVATEMMLHSNAVASRLAVTNNALACTDITGFGLVGHLQEMLEPGQVININSAKLPALPGALESLTAGIRSTMHEANATAAASCVAVVGSFETARTELVYDPQTSGGLLIAVSPERADSLCEQLLDAGYLAATVIGGVQAPSPNTGAQIIIS